MSERAAALLAIGVLVLLVLVVAIRARAGIGDIIAAVIGTAILGSVMAVLTIAVTRRR